MSNSLNLCIKVREKNYVKNIVKIAKTYYFYITIRNEVARPN